jgi:hypothetical protein
VSPGDSATFNIAVTNIGDVRLTNVQVTDALVPECSKAIGTLEPGAKTGYTCTAFKVTEDMVNSATVTGKPPVGPEVSATDTAVVHVARPAVTIKKLVSSDGQAWHDADTPAETLPVLAGTDVYFKLAVSNSGDGNLTNIKLSDSQHDVSGCTVPATLASGASLVCVVGPFAAAEGQQMDTATVSADHAGSTLSDTDSAYYDGAKLVVTAQAQGVPPTISINWACPYPQLAMQYRYAIGTTPGSQEVVDWVYVPSTTSPAPCPFHRQGTERSVEISALLGCSQDLIRRLGHALPQDTQLFEQDTSLIPVSQRGCIDAHVQPGAFHGGTRHPRCDRSIRGRRCAAGLGDNLRQL